MALILDLREEYVDLCEAIIVYRASAKTPKSTKKKFILTPHQKKKISVESAAKLSDDWKCTDDLMRRFHT